MRIIRIKELQAKIGLGRSSIYEKLDPKSPRYDASFPLPLALGASAKGWLDKDVDEWLESLARASRPEAA